MDFQIFLTGMMKKQDNCKLVCVSMKNKQPQMEPKTHVLHHDLHKTPYKLQTYAHNIGDIEDIITTKQIRLSLTQNILKIIQFTVSHVSCTHTSKRHEWKQVLQNLSATSIDIKIPPSIIHQIIPATTERTGKHHILEFTIKLINIFILI